ncbi:MAG: DNA mismatch repair protein MutS [Eubacteriales bacterium]|nr:DNA mismatch repair protein MutS [Eubacteriales bacterium]
MMEMYCKTKEEYKDCILFYRLGDFYEMFFEDAITCSRELEITLTGKDCGMEERAPMCGIPFHAYENYMNRLVEKGYKVAICEQVEDPKQAKGLVKREVIQIVTPGTNMSSSSLNETKNNYLMSIFGTSKKNDKNRYNLSQLDQADNLVYGISFADITTGDFYTTEVDSFSKVMDEIAKFSPVEILMNQAVRDIESNEERLQLLRGKENVMISVMEDWYYEYEMDENLIKDQFKTMNLEGMGLKDYPNAVCSVGCLIYYLKDTQKGSIEHMNHISTYQVDDFVVLDSASRRNLELCETMRDKNKRGSLLWVLDKTKTAMGARRLRTMVEQPCIRKEMIEERLDAIEALNDSLITRDELREYLNAVYDLERLMTRITLKSANPRDLIAFKNSIGILPHVKTILKEFDTGILAEYGNELEELSDLFQLIEDSIVEEPPITIKEGGIIKDGYHDVVDELKAAKSDGKQWLMDLEAKERENTGIKNLKIKFNKVFGYYFDVTNSFKNLVPDYFIRKQTLANSERYSTDELEDIAGKILGAEDRLFGLEYDLFVAVRDKIGDEVKRVQKSAKIIADLDALASLAYVAEKNHFIRPSINTEGRIDIKEGRHPVVEKVLNNDSFITNDTFLDNASNRVSIITGPNMAGKSTYMRQVALIVLMAQIGSYVPATSADIGIVDRIFTRVGASDDLASGQSTFMVEMSEVANILRNATSNSLLILDEIGRGTSTYDGLSIAWAVVEYISSADLLGAKTLFATHYHELTELEGKLDGVNNYCISVKESGDDIVFLRKIIKGGADKSYGIQVAKLAGVPEVVLARAKEISAELSDHDINVTAAADIVPKLLEEKRPTKGKKKEADGQMSLFGNVEESSVVADIKALDLSNMTPMKALIYLSDLQERLQ